MNISDCPFLDADEMSPDPFSQFGSWYERAESAGQPSPETCCLATATSDGRPSARIVLLKAFDSRGFVVFTNYNSRKAAELESNPHAALTFHWPSTESQIRIEGIARRTSHNDNLAYFISRPYESRLGAWASNQSTSLGSRDELIKAFEHFRAKYPDSDNVPLPKFWGGYRIDPVTIEFWQQGPWRLHDRFRYSIDGNLWRMERLAP